MSSGNSLASSATLFTAGIGLSALASAGIASLSLVAVPMALNQQTNAGVLAAWRNVLFKGGAVCIPIGISATLVHAANAYINLNTSPDNTRTKYLAAAALTTVLFVPFTIIFIAPTNSLLLADEKDARGTATKVASRTIDLVKAWSLRNLIRSCLPAAGALIAFMSP